MHVNVNVRECVCVKLTTLSAMHDEELGKHGKPEYISVSVCVVVCVVVCVRECECMYKREREALDWAQAKRASCTKHAPIHYHIQLFSSIFFHCFKRVQVAAVIKNLPTEVGSGKKSIVYEACPNPNPDNPQGGRTCQKKLTEQGSSWSCQRCGVVSADAMSNSACLCATNE